MPQVIMEESETIRRLHIDFERAFSRMVDPLDTFYREGKGYATPYVNAMWLAWVSCYETYVGSTHP